MRLLIDIGNTQIKYVFDDQYCSEKLSEVAYISYQAFQEQLLSGMFNHVDEIILASVKSTGMEQAIAKFCMTNEIAFRQVQSQEQAFGVKSAYKNPASLGVDRWLAMIGAQWLYPQCNILVIDAGTAITVDLLASDGQHCGGWIMPGIEILFNSVVQRTQKITAIANIEARLNFGQDSSSCVNHGSWAMTIGAVKEAIKQANSQLTLDKVLITGGNGSAIVNLIDQNCEFEPKLVFHGLRCFQAS